MLTRWRDRTSVAVLVLLACGCAGGASSDREATVAGPPPCRPDRGAPITEREPKGALDAEGVRLLRASDCSGDELELSNITDAVPNDQEDAIMASDGHIFCELSPEAPSPRLERFAWRNDPDPAYVRSSTSRVPSTPRAANRPTRSNERSADFRA